MSQTQQPPGWTPGLLPVGTVIGPNGVQQPGRPQPQPQGGLFPQGSAGMFQSLGGGMGNSMAGPPPPDPSTWAYQSLPQGGPGANPPAGQQPQMGNGQMPPGMQPGMMGALFPQMGQGQPATTNPNAVAAPPTSLGAGPAQQAGLDPNKLANLAAFWSQANGGGTKAPPGGFQSIWQPGGGGLANMAQLQAAANPPPPPPGGPPGPGGMGGMGGQPSEPQQVRAINNAWMNPPRSGGEGAR